MVFSDTSSDYYYFYCLSCANLVFSFSILATADIEGYKTRVTLLLQSFSAENVRHRTSSSLLIHSFIEVLTYSSSKALEYFSNLVISA